MMLRRRLWALTTMRSCGLRHFQTKPPSGPFRTREEQEELDQMVYQDVERWEKLAPEAQRQDLETELKEFEWLLTQSASAELTPEFKGYEHRIAEMLAELKPAGALSDSDRTIPAENEDLHNGQISKSEAELEEHNAAPVQIRSAQIASILQDLLPTNTPSTPQLPAQSNPSEARVLPTAGEMPTKLNAPKIADSELEALLSEDAQRSPSTQLFVAPEVEGLVKAKAPGETSHPFTILFEDDHILAVAKPPGIVVIPARGEDKGSMLSTLKQYYGPLRSVFTLDSQSSGVVLFTRTPQAFPVLSKCLDSGELKNTFIGWVDGKLNKQEGNINIPLQAARKSRMRPVDGWVPGPEHKLSDSVVRRNVPVHPLVNAATLKAKLTAVTRFILSRVFCLPKGKFVTRVLFRPLTHRQHQIRVHMRAVGLPFLVDSSYGFSSSLRANELGRDSPALSTVPLHNMDISFPHPFTGVRTKVSCPLSSCNPDLKRLDDWLILASPKDTSGNLKTAEQPTKTEAKETVASSRPTLLRSSSPISEV